MILNLLQPPKTALLFIGAQPQQEAQLLERQPTPENQCWAHALRQTAAYYQQQDPIRAGILEQRYRRHQTEQQVLDTLHIGRTTYQKANADLLSTLAVYAAKQGVL